MKKACVSIAVGMASVLLLITGLTSDLNAKDYEMIRDPKPTQSTQNIVELVKVKEISGDLDDTHFFALPNNLAVDGDGNIYVYDRKLVKIFKFDNRYRLEKVFGNQGKGPGEMTRGDSGTKMMYIAKDGNLYVHSWTNRKIIVFSKEGKLVKEIRLPEDHDINSFCPVVDANGNIYTRSANGGAVDRFDQKMNQRYTFLNYDIYKKFIVFEPFPATVAGRLYPCITNTFYDILSGNRLLIYIENSSSVYLFQCDKLIRQFNAWPARAIRARKIAAVATLKREKDKPSERNWYPPFMLNFFVDKDDERFFYIDPRGFEKKRGLFKYDLKGNLLAAYTYYDGHARIMAKRNDLFYALDGANGILYVYKEKK